MKFQKYSTIENSYRTGFTDKIICEGLSSGEWVIQEKIHGANFSMYATGEEVKAARRTEFLTMGEQFYSCSEVIGKYSADARNMFKTSGAKQELIIYGELFGGNYPHRGVAQNNNVSAVQKGIYYSPNIEFMVFDIQIDGEYLNIYMVSDLCCQHNIPFIPVIKKGTYKECLKYPNNFQSMISLDLSLPEIKDNQCEGVVIKPSHPKFLGNGCRVILKNKNPKFAEKVKEPKPIPEPLSGDLLVVAESMSTFITKNRLVNVLSKIGEVTDKDFGRILGLFVQDVITDFKKEHNNLDNFDKKGQKKVFKSVNRLCAALIRENFLNIIDGNF